jgi:hypothetical protein
MEEANETLEQLELLIGKENAEKVFKFFEGMSMYFPKNIGLKEQHEKIYRELCNGASYTAVSIKYGYTKSYIRKIQHKISLQKRKNKDFALPLQSGIENNKSKKLPAGNEFIFEQGDLFYGQ